MSQLVIALKLRNGVLGLLDRPPRSLTLGNSYPKNDMAKHLESSDIKVIRRIHAHKRGWTFTLDSFKDLGSRSARDHALARYAEKGTIRKLARGLYDYPKIDPLLGPCKPSTDDIAKALNRNSGDAR